MRTEQYNQRNLNLKLSIHVQFYTAPVFRANPHTADETWLHHYEPETKAQSMAWKRPTSPVAKKFKS
jgi:hypothetical protein